jgi:hypothetical protein
MTSEIVSYCVSIVLAILAVWQTIKNNNLKKYLKAEAMEFYSNTGILLGNAQACLRAIREGDTNLAIQTAGQAEGMAQSLFARSVKNIYHLFTFSRDDVNNWITQKKIDSAHRDAFLKHPEK